MMLRDQTQFTPAAEIPCLDDLAGWQALLEQIIGALFDGDGSHDIGHYRRVYRNALAIVSGSKEKTHPFVLLAAAMLHDIVNLPKNHPERHLASRHSAQKAAEILRGMGICETLIERIYHAIEAHSFSAGIKARTFEAKVLQDADRLDALGAIGLARTFYVNGKMGTQLFDIDDPMGEQRDLDDKSFALDHFEMKLLKLPQMMQTPMGKILAHRRAKILKRFRAQLLDEIEMAVLPLPKEA